MLNTSIIDEVFKVKNEDAFAASKALARHEGLIVVFHQELQLCSSTNCQAAENKGKTIVALLPDTGERYISTALFQEG